MMDNDASTEATSTSRQKRQRRRVIIGAVAAVAVIAVVVPAVLHGGLGSNSSRAGVATRCPALNQGQKPNITPAPNINWSDCDLSGADLSGADLTGADLSRANMTGAAITNAVFTGATLNGIRESRSLTGQPRSLPTSWLWVTQGYLIGPGVNLSGEDLSDSGANGAYLAGVNLTGANLTGAYLLYVDFTGAIFTNAILTGALFAQGASGLLVSGVTWRNATCPNGSNATLAGAGTCIRQGGGL